MNRLALAALVAFLSASASGQTAPKGTGANHPFDKVDLVYQSNGCSFAFSPVNFCDERHMAAYKQAIDTRKADFAGHYILLSVPEWPRYHQQSIVAIDANTGIAYPLPIDAYSGPADPKGEIHSDGVIEYTANASHLCIKGGILVYRSVDEGSFCFKFEGNRFTGHQTEYMN